jgi:hypothetical protein
LREATFARSEGKGTKLGGAGGKGTKLGEEERKVRLSQDRMPILGEGERD